MKDKHHIHPKFMDNKKGLGKIYELEKGEHIKLHLIIPKLLWKYVRQEDKQNCINEVIRFSEKFINNINNIEKEKVKQKELTEEYITEEELEDIKICCLCGYENDIEDTFCNGCGSSIAKEEEE
jgi:hypothetical protein